MSPNGYAAVKSNGDPQRGSSGYSTSHPVYDAEDPHRRWTPWLVPVLVVVHVAAFVVTMYFNDCPSDSFRSGACVGTALRRFSFQPVSENPLFGPSAKTLVKLGGLLRSNVVYKKQAWRLFTCIYLHAGLVHLVANMISLLFIGIRLEQQFGFIRIGIIYVISGFGGSVLSGLFTVRSVSVGASSCLFGLLGAMLAELLTNWTIYSNKAAAVVTLLAVVIINLVPGILPFVDNFGHIGGFATGFLLGFVLLLRPQFGWVERHDASAASRVSSKYQAYQLILLVTGLLVLAGGLAVALYMLFDKRDVRKDCSWCHYISCVPTSKWNCDEI